jgi:hypothetical protein
VPDDRKTCFVVCPFCGGRVQHDPGYLTSWYICQECSYQGSFIIEADSLEDIKKLKEYLKTHKGDNIVPANNGVHTPDSPKESLIKNKSFKRNYNVFGEEYHLNVSGEKYYLDQFGKKYKRCLFCLESLDIDDKKCRFCGYDPNDKKIKWATVSVISLVIFFIVLGLADIYFGYEFHLIYDNISLIFVLLSFILLIILTINFVIIAIKSIKQ